ncbi:MAG: 2OG-Fe(II) oxygenase [Pseudomonadota bacterium]
MTQRPAWPLPPVARINDFLPRDEHRALLEWVLGNEELFRPSKLIINDGPAMKSLVDPEFRLSMTTRKLGALAPGLEQRMREALPALEQAIGAKTGATSIELELAAHGDGAHYGRHVDMQYGEDRQPVGARPGEDRVLSAVYYFHREPKRFSGGALRLYRFNIRPARGTPTAEDYVDIEPAQNSLVAFAPWVTHEVRPVTCPSQKFEDYRFALNCWFCRKL